MSLIKYEEVKSDARWMSSAGVDEEVEEIRNNLQVSAVKQEGSSSLYDIPEFQYENEDDDHSLADSTSCDEYTDSEQSTASEELQSHKASYSKIPTLAEIDKGFALVNQKERRRERAQSKVRKYGQALLQAKKDEAEAQNTLMRAKKDCQASRKHFNAALDAVGVSPQLIDEYQAFCESLQPKSGISGFSILCDEPHGGDYVDYDPEFDHFKDNVERSYKNKNFRCEASSTTSKRMVGRHSKRAKVVEYEVEFFPLPDIEPVNGSERTWGEQYPKLYKLAIEAAKRGSGIALEILVRLPGKDYKFNGGWLFDYEFDELAKDDPVVSNRWKFRSAHRIKKPVSAKEKRRLLKLECGIY